MIDLKDYEGIVSKIRPSDTVLLLLYRYGGNIYVTVKQSEGPGQRNETCHSRNSLMHSVCPFAEFAFRGPDEGARLRRCSSVGAINLKIIDLMKKGRKIHGRNKTHTGCEHNDQIL